MKKFFALLLAVCTLTVACMSFTACDTSTDGAELSGFDIEFAKAMGEYVDVEVRFQRINWDTKINELDAKNIDLIWNGMTITEELQNALCISNPYMKNKQVAVVKKENEAKYADFNSIKNAAVVAESGSAGAEYAEKHLNKTPVKSQSQADALLEIINGSSEVAIIDKVMADYYAVTGDYAGKIAVIDNLEGAGEEYYGIAARKADTGVINKVNLALKQMYNDGKITEIATTYGLEDLIMDCSNYEDNGESAGWDYITEKGTLVIGYTLFAPIAYEI